METTSKKPVAALRQRAAAFAVAAVASASVLSAVATLFDQASHEPLLRDTPQARTALALCAAREPRAERRACTTQVVAQARARDAGLTRVAKRASGAEAGTGDEPR